MNNLHRDLAPISEAAWADLEEEARRTFRRWLAGRRVVDVVGPCGLELAAVGTGRLTDLDRSEEGVLARVRQARPLVELRVPFRVRRDEVDAVERGAKDADWGPVKEAMRKLALAEDGAIFRGAAGAGIEGIVESSSNETLDMPEDVRDLPEAVSKALTSLRLAGVDGPYSLLLGPDAYTAAAEVTDQGYPVRDHIAHLIDGDVIWAPALVGGLVMSTRGGDYELRLGQDASIGYLSHDADSIELYAQESLTFFSYTDEASVVIGD